MSAYLVQDSKLGKSCWDTRFQMAVSSAQLALTSIRNTKPTGFNLETKTRELGS